MDRFDDLDLREEPAGSDRNGSAPVSPGCTQDTFACAADRGLRTPVCCF